MNKKRKLLLGLFLFFLGILFVGVFTKLYLERVAVEKEIGKRKNAPINNKEEILSSSSGNTVIRDKYPPEKKEPSKEKEGKDEKYGADFFRDEKNYIFRSKELKYNDEKYIRNSAVKAYIILGIDRRGGFDKEIHDFKAGQADAIFVLAHDTAGDRVSLIQVHRDSMAPVTITDKDGKPLYRELAQINVAFGYGDGKEMSVEYMAKSLSDLFFGFQFDGYMVGSLENIKTLNDYIGGVEVTVEEEGLEKFDPEFVKGRKVLLLGDKAEKYVRSRDVKKSRTAYKRLDRQRQYLNAYNAKLKTLLREDSDLFVKLFNKVEDTTLTSLRKDEYVSIGIDMADDPDVSNIISLPGFIETANEYEEFYPKLSVLRDIIVKTFYRKLQF